MGISFVCKKTFHIMELTAWKISQRTNRVIKFFDDEIDKYYLCGLSPYTLFKNTRSDMGQWDKLQDEKCKEEWDALSKCSSFCMVLFPPC